MQKLIYRSCRSASCAQVARCAWQMRAIFLSLREKWGRCSSSGSSQVGAAAVGAGGNRAASSGCAKNKLLPSWGKISAKDEWSRQRLLAKASCGCRNGILCLQSANLLPFFTSFLSLLLHSWYSSKKLPLLVASTTFPIDFAYV